MPMKLGEYYTIEELSRRYGVQPLRIHAILKAEQIEVEHFSRAPAIHESEVKRLDGIRHQRQVDNHIITRRQLQAAGFEYHTKRPAWVPRGTDGQNSVFRRGWWLPPAAGGILIEKLRGSDGAQKMKMQMLPFDPTQPHFFGSSALVAKETAKRYGVWPCRGLPCRGLF